MVQPGDSDDVSQLAAHVAARVGDGGLGVALVNQTTWTPKIALALKDFVPCAAQRYTLAGTSYADISITLNG